jgi:hypothetical protein
MKQEQFCELIENLWNHSSLISIFKSVFGSDWENRVQKLAHNLDPEHYWMLSHQVSLKQDTSTIPIFPLLTEDDLSEKDATLAQNGNYSYTRNALETFELQPLWDIEDALNAKDEILLAWEEPNCDPEARFATAPNYNGWLLKIKRCQYGDAAQTLGELFLSAQPYGTIYLGLQPDLLNREKVWEHLNMLGGK